MAAYRIGVLASGGGSNLQSLMDRIQTGELPAELSFVLSNNSKSGALAKAKSFGTAAYHVSAVTQGGDEAAAAHILDLVKRHGIDLLVLAGYMKLLPPAILALLKNRVVNIHPALLPAFGGAGFYGQRVHEAIIAHGCQYSGVTIHMVNEVYDQGQIILQRMLPVQPGWSPEELGAEVLKLEHLYYWQVVRGFAVGEIVPTASEVPGKAVEISRFLSRMAHEEKAHT